MGMDESTWHSLSLIIRLSHECTHYFTRRLFGSMRNNLLDELIADYQGIVAANGGRYRADWFLRFVGLESFPDYRPPWFATQSKRAFTGNDVLYLQCRL